MPLYNNTIFAEILFNEFGAAIALLKYSDWSITEIAGLCGFSIAGHFATLFKHKYSHTPSDIRKNSAMK
ncbi:MAG: helix-turn-helix domain-containing protein [Lentisphaeria bacterium]|nr:helix-turn-helix domain-containing protein [Lentisphaeria bacterium]